MFGSRSSDDEVTCIACGEQIAREVAREYDKRGDRWDRHGKSFEFLCKACHRDLCRQPRDGLEERLTEAGAGERDRDAFLRAYRELSAEGAVEDAD